MALRAVPEHPKFAAFKAIIEQPKGPAAGWLEMVWHFAGRFTPQGNIGKYSDKEIEAWVEWDGPPGKLIDALIQSRWLDRDPVHRLLVHDWAQHADKATKNALMRAQLAFCTPGVRTDGQESSTASRLPEPVPVPVPVPEKRKASRAKPARAADPRHQGCKEAIRAYWESKNPAGSMPWDGSEAKVLSALLSASPNLTAEWVTALLRNRFKSEVNHGDRPSKWLRSLLSYNSGPIDRFGKPISEGAARPAQPKLQILAAPGVESELTA
jgi:hypothetical protein